MEKYTCLKRFSNGRALGGHMGSLMLNPCVPPKTEQQLIQLSDDTESASSPFPSSSSEEEENEEKELGYGLGENPKKSIRWVDAGSVVLQDGESQTESSKNPTQRRSKRVRKSENPEATKLKSATLGATESSWAEQEPVSSISDTTPGEDVDYCNYIGSHGGVGTVRHRMPLQRSKIIINYYSAVLVLIFLLLGSSAAASSSFSLAKPNCPQKCKDVIVPYPFGIGKGCYRDKVFEVLCNESAGLSYMLGLQPFEISLDHYLRVDSVPLVNCNFNGSDSTLSIVSYDYLGPFHVSTTQNKLVVVGCDVHAYVTDDLGTNTHISGGCSTFCSLTGDDRIDPSTHRFDNLSACFGDGCCQTSLPAGLRDVKIVSLFIRSGPQSMEHHPCSTAFIVENNFSDFSNLSSFKTNKTRDVDYLFGAPVMVEWGIGNISCDEARRRKDYACGSNTDCIETNVVDGVEYQCRCSQGYQGNPYLPSGCQDIDECKGPKKNVCPKGSLCNNTGGSYSCTCPPGFYSVQGNGIGCKPDRGRISLVPIIPLGIAIAVGVPVLVIGIWWHRKLEKRRVKKMKQKFFKRNGGLILEKEISSSEETLAKTKLFTAEELEKATDNYNGSRVIGKGGYGTVYKGMLSNGDIVAVKLSNKVDEARLGQFINEILILSKINHRHIVKLLGCCLETEVPVLVYEYVSNGTLFDHLHASRTLRGHFQDENSASRMSWNTRLRIAGEVAGALSYMHSHASPAIFHRDIKSTNILLDENYKAIVSDFGISRLVAVDKTHLTTERKGTIGYLDPHYFRTMQFTDKSDVYAFGVVLAELLTGGKVISSKTSSEGLVERFKLSMGENNLSSILDAQIVSEGQEEDIQVVANLVMRCLKTNPKKRPSMTEVVAELKILSIAEEQALIHQSSSDSYHMGSQSSSYAIVTIEEEDSHNIESERPSHEIEEET